MQSREKIKIREKKQPGADGSRHSSQLQTTVRFAEDEQGDCSEKKDARIGVVNVTHKKAIQYSRSAFPTSVFGRGAHTDCNF